MSPFNRKTQREAKQKAVLRRGKLAARRIERETRMREMRLKRLRQHNQQQEEELQQRRISNRHLREDCMLFQGRCELFLDSLDETEKDSLSMRMLRTLLQNQMSLHDIGNNRE